MADDDGDTTKLQAEHGPLKQTTIKMPALAGGDEVDRSTGAHRVTMTGRTWGRSARPAMI